MRVGDCDPPQVALTLEVEIILSDRSLGSYEMKDQYQ